MEDGLAETGTFGFPQKEEEEERETKRQKEEDRPGGLISHFISNLVSGSGCGEDVDGGEKGETEKTQEKDDENRVHKPDGDVGGGGGGGGGIITNLISNLLQTERNKGDDEKKQREEKGISEATERDKGGIIDSIVSHLPPNLRDDVDPATDEASILIHSIVHD
ncbi:hypothetical protein NMG60_11035995 [Bertholletia excelsa]